MPVLPKLAGGDVFGKNAIQCCVEHVSKSSEIGRLYGLSCWKHGAYGAYRSYGAYGCGWEPGKQRLGRLGRLGKGVQNLRGSVQNVFAVAVRRGRPAPRTLGLWKPLSGDPVQNEGRPCPKCPGRPTGPICPTGPSWTGIAACPKWFGCSAVRLGRGCPKWFRGHGISS